MIREVEIEHFKSIRYLRLEARRVNVFIGPPNTGKSNILEALGVFSLPYTNGDLRSLVRCTAADDLFYNHDTEHPIRVRADADEWQLRFNSSGFPPFSLTFSTAYRGVRLEYRYGYDARMEGGTVSAPALDFPICFYRFAPVERFPFNEPAFLRPPAGENMLYLLLTRKSLRERVVEIFREYELRPVLKPQEGRIEVQREVDGVIIAHPYEVVSETLRRLIFHLVAMETHAGAALIFEEPEAHAFPYHTQHLAERIALDARNQYFLSTHNPYFLLSILEKARREEVAVFLTAWRKGETRVRPLTEEEIEILLDLEASLFFNLDRFWAAAEMPSEEAGE